MDILGYLIGKTLYYAIDAVTIMMLFHVIISWVAPESDNAFLMVINTVVGFVTLPVRLLLSRFEGVSSMPIDISFTVTWMLLMMLQAGLGAII